MPYFRYTATDPSGKSLSGTIHAKNQLEAAGTLSARGMKSVAFDEAGKSKEPPAVRTGRASDKQLLFLFSQLASLSKAGLNSHDAWDKMAQRAPSYALRKACDEISLKARAGGSVASAMEPFIDIFPHNAVAMVRAGEYGGFLPEAYRYLAELFAASAAFKRWFWFLKFVSWQTFVGLMLFLPLFPALWKTFQEGGGPFDLINTYKVMLLYPTLPIFGSIALAGICIILIFRSHSLTRFRHSFVSGLPWGIGKRVREESLMAFLWTLQNLSRAGIAPGTSWALAAASAPNVEYAIRLSDAGRILGSEKPLSLAMSEARLFPDDYDAMLNTAEITGDIPNTIEHMLALTKQEYDMADTRSRAGLSQIGCLIMILTAGILAFIVVNQYYLRVFDEVDKLMNK